MVDLFKFIGFRTPKFEQLFAILTNPWQMLDHVDLFFKLRKEDQYFVTYCAVCFNEIRNFWLNQMILPSYVEMQIFYKLVTIFLTYEFLNCCQFTHDKTYS